jgi:DNA-directed RNA polymerase beta subunit
MAMPAAEREDAAADAARREAESGQTASQVTNGERPPVEDGQPAGESSREPAEAVALPPPPEEAYGPVAEVANDGLTEDDMVSYVSAAADSGGMVNFNIESFNELVDEGIGQIITRLFEIDKVVKNQRDQTEQDKQRESFRIQYRFTDVKVGRPQYGAYPSGEIADLHPNRARLSGLPYSAPLVLGAEVTVTARYQGGREEVRRAEVPPFQVSTLPVMKGCNRCHTWGLTRAACKALEEDPSEPGGYFIAKGQEWMVSLLENIRFNTPHIHRKVLASERVRAEFISQPGGAYENSSQVVLRYMESGQLTFEIQSKLFNRKRIPFYVLFRAFGVANDVDLVEYIAFARPGASAGPVESRMREIVGRALHLADPDFEPMRAVNDRREVGLFLGERLLGFVEDPVAYRANAEAERYVLTHFYKNMDEMLLPHLGQTAADRPRKLQFLGLLYHKLLLVELGVTPPADRDSFRIKRAHGAGVSLAKAFKSMFNESVVRPITRALQSELKSTPFEQLTARALKGAFYNPLAATGGDLDRTMQQSIVSGNKSITVRRRPVTNRVSSDSLERKTQLNMLSQARTVVAHNSAGASKQAERADQIRRVHPSYLGYICVSQSADTGEKVGMAKQLALTADVCTAGPVWPLKQRLRGDPELISLDEVTNTRIAREGLARVYLNGEWIGCCARGHAFAARYRRLRRAGRVLEPRATVVWDPLVDEVEFWLDVGRLTRPLLIVDNNLDEYDAACRAASAARREGAADWQDRKVRFVQNVRFTPEHARALRAGRLDLAALVRAGVAEWITPEEAENCLVAPTLEDLRGARHDVTQRYTHCDVPQAVLGLAALVSPYANHTQPARITYETNQARQTAGWYCYSYPFRADQMRIFQWYNEVPLVRTLAHRYVTPNGLNAVVAYMVYGGENQEDSAIVSRAFVDRGGFTGSFFRYHKVELDGKGEFFGTPDPVATRNLKPNASYEKLEGGFVRVGTRLERGDVIVGRVGRERQGDRHELVDRSLVYQKDEPAEVDAVWRPRGANDEEFALVRLRYERPLVVGDKLCLTPEHEVLSTRGWVPVAEVGFRDEVACLEEGGLVYRRPLELHAYDHAGDVYVVEGGVNQRVTLDHRMYVERRAGAGFELVPARELVGEAARCGYKRSAANAQPGSRAYALADGTTLPMGDWLRLLGLHLGRMASPDSAPCGGSYVAACGVLGLGCVGADERLEPRHPAARDALRQAEERLICRAGLPPYVWGAGQEQAATLLRALQEAGGDPFVTDQRVLADDLTRLALHAGRSADLGGSLPRLRVSFAPAEAPAAVEREAVEHYEGKVHCLTVPGHVLYVRRNGVPSWTGNSSREGNKSITASLLPQSDMPYTEDGLRPDIIINPHSVPTRMIVGQMIETLAGQLCARRGRVTDGTAFRKIDPEAMREELAAAGLRHSGLSRLYNGRTGEPFDAAIFIGPTTYQRLQKFVADDSYAVGSRGPTDALTGQPLDGKKANGGMKLGEMENWVLSAHGAGHTMNEKLREDSDGRTLHLCRRCGQPAVYNAAREIHRCLECGEKADFAAVDSCRASIAFQHELRSANVRLKTWPTPRRFERYA